MRKHFIEAEVVSVERVAYATVSIGLKAAEIAGQVQPGQFVMVGSHNADTHDPFLNRPFSVHECDQKTTIQLLIGIVGRGTQNLARLEPGNRLSVLGPLGTGFNVPAAADPVIIIGGGLGIAPLNYLARQSLKNGKKVILLYGAGSREQLIPTADLESLGVKIKIATDDGSRGVRGNAAMLLESRLADIAAETRKQAYLAACGPWKMLQALAEICSKNVLNLEVSLESKMACGVGACLGCTHFLSDGSGQRVCKEGPVFSANEVFGT
ncbi:MAG: dihydroorotate dehydrogenase electron transfer subunit [Deltaproteobacteria bacterium]|nr:dihydroorotate dehydrogenase electron transfer subunit [Deltaproteobacteria bacterium]